MIRLPVSSGATRIRPAKTIGDPADVTGASGSCNTRSRHKDNGFTLVELTAVMVVIAILALVAIPTLTRLSDDRATLAARQLLRDLSFARQRAVATGTRSWVVFDTGNHSWSVLAEDPTTPGRTNASVIEDPATGHDFIQPLDINQFVGVQLQAVDFDTDVEIGFDWLGQPLNGAENPLSNDGSVTVTTDHVIKVEVETGYVTYTPP